MIELSLLTLGFIAQASGSLYYAYLTAKGIVQPNRVTFLIWGLVPIIACIIQFFEGVGLAALSLFALGFFPFLIFCLSFLNKDSYWRLGIIDYICGILAILAVCIWVYTQDAFTAIALTIIADFFAFIPTLVKILKAPQTENVFSYLGAITNSAIGLILVQSWIFIEYGFLLYVLIQCVVAAVLIERKRIFRFFGN